MIDNPDPFGDTIPDGSDYFVTPEGQTLLYHIGNAGAALRGTQADLATLSEYWDFTHRFIEDLDDLASEIIVQTAISQE